MLDLDQHPDMHARKNRVPRSHGVFPRRTTGDESLRRNDRRAWRCTPSLRNSGAREFLTPRERLDRGCWSASASRPRPDLTFGFLVRLAVPMRWALRIAARGTVSARRCFSAKTSCSLYSAPVGRGVALPPPARPATSTSSCGGSCAARIREIALSAGDSLGRARDAHAADGDPGIERNHDPLRPARGEAQPVERDDQLRIEAPGADDPDVSRRRAPGRRADGIEARAVRRRGCRRNLPETRERPSPNASKFDRSR